MKLTAKNTEFKSTQIIGLALFIFALVVYSKLFSASFISWDDGDVLLNNKDVHQFNLKAFFTRFYVGNFAPITMMSFALDWFMFKGNALAHHAINVAFQMANAVLVYQLAALLLKDKLKALLCAVVFFFHPFQVETVAWVSAKNNLLYAFFFLLALIQYTKYVLFEDKKRYLYTLLFFLLSVLSKPSAICFPFVIMAFDYVLKHKLDWKLLINKIPFILVSIGFGLGTLYTRTEDKFINQHTLYGIHERIGNAGFAVLQYLYKFFIPINLSVIYPYPPNKAISVSIGYGVILALGFACYHLYKTKKKLVLFGVAFFIINLLLVLQLIPFGEVLTADRYMYLPIIGISIAAVSLFPIHVRHLKVITIALVLVFGSLTFLRTLVWKNSITLFTDTANKHPHSFVTLNSLGAEYMLTKNYDMGLRYLNAAINENTNYYKGYYNRGLLYAQTERMTLALNDFNRAIDLKHYSKAYVARANVFYSLKDFPKAMRDAEVVLKQEPNNVKAKYIIANCYDDLNQLDQALQLYNQVIALNTENPLYYLRRAIVYGKLQQFEKCLMDLEICQQLDPNYAEAYYWKGVVKVNLKQNPCGDLKRALDLGFMEAQNPLQMYCR